MVGLVGKISGPLDHGLGGFEDQIAARNLGGIPQELHDTLLQGFPSASKQVHVAADGLPQDSSAKPTLARALELWGKSSKRAGTPFEGSDRLTGAVSAGKRSSMHSATRGEEG